MKAITSCSGQDLVDMFSCAAVWLDVNVPHINSLNVFPVPDGDTGINMSLTMRSAISEASQVSNGTASEVIRAISHGALMGARGNSGVILSQILRGFAVPLNGKAELEAGDFVAGLEMGSSLAYKAVSHPVEGTILTVIRESAQAAGQLADKSDFNRIIETIVSAAKDSVDKTPQLLAMLREAGVVDAGGLGLYVIFEGFQKYLRGEKVEAGAAVPEPTSAAGAHGDEIAYGYCTEFVIEGSSIDVVPIRKHLENIGESVMVVKHDDIVRAHVHTFDPGAALGYAASLGVLKQVKVEDMDKQHKDLADLSNGPEMDIATVAVVQGDGMEEVFRSLGITAVVRGGQTMNPSTQELLKAVEAVPSDKVVVLPNNKNVILTAEQTATLTKKKLAVVPTETVPQGIAALLALNNTVDFAANFIAMKEAASNVLTVEVTKAVRDTAYGDLSVKEGQDIALIDNDLIASGDGMSALMEALVLKIDLSHREVVTIYYGADVKSREPAAIAKLIRKKYPHLEVEAVYGGQPHYSYIVSVE
jgi:DAK2 domain fusion protein YloV